MYNENNTKQQRSCESIHKNIEEYENISRRGNVDSENIAESIRKGYIDNGLSSKFGAEYADDWRSYRRQEFRKELSTNQKQSTNNQNGISNANANRRIRRLIFIVKKKTYRKLILNCISG